MAGELVVLRCCLRILGFDLSESFITNALQFSKAANTYLLNEGKTNSNLEKVSPCTGCFTNSISVAMQNV